MCPVIIFWRIWGVIVIVHRVIIFMIWWCISCVKIPAYPIIYISISIIINPVGLIYP